MPAIARLGDICSGHACFPPRVNTSAASKTFINSIPAHRKGDSWATHRCGKSSHGGTTSGGSGKGFVEGSPLARVGDAIDCGSMIAQGSPDCFSD
jgi:uncharacterized Zn-binding protein involved in type VI secretion